MTRNASSALRVGAVVVAAAMLSLTPVPVRAADDKVATPTVPSDTKPPASSANTASEDLATAARLAEYGRATNSPLALVVAAQMVRSVTVSPGGDAKVRPNSTDPANPAPKPGSKTDVLDADGLIAEARKMAGDDKALAAAIDAAAAQQQTAVASKKLRGGAQCRVDRIYPGQVDMWEVNLRPDSYQNVTVVSDGDCDIDCYAFDQAGNILKAEDSYSAHCGLSWYTRFGGVFTLAVRNANCGVYADYRLCAD